MCVCVCVFMNKCVLEDIEIIVLNKYKLLDKDKTKNKFKNLRKFEKMLNLKDFRCVFMRRK